LLLTIIQLITFSLKVILILIKRIFFLKEKFIKNVLYYFGVFCVIAWFFLLLIIICSSELFIFTYDLIM